MLFTFVMLLPTIMEMSPYQIIQILSNNLTDYENTLLAEFKPDSESESNSDSDSESESESESDLESELIEDEAGENDVFREPSPPPRDTYNTSTIYELGTEPEVGNIIRFTERINGSTEDIREECSNLEESAPRCISTYNMEEVEPKPGFQDEPGELYVVVSKTHLIPNPKGLALHAAIEDNENLISTRNTHLIVEPLGGLEENQSIFWYINFTDLTVRQFEGGAIKIEIDNLEIIGNDDKITRSAAPSPESDFGDWDNEEEYTSSISEIDYPEEESSEEYNSDYNRDLYYEYSTSMYGYGGDPNFND